MDNMYNTVKFNSKLEAIHIFIIHSHSSNQLHVSHMISRITKIGAINNMIEVDYAEAFIPAQI